eukprot:3912491-Pyramimonas_sp.AAC.3
MDRRRKPAGGHQGLNGGDRSFRLPDGGLWQLQRAQGPGNHGVEGKDLRAAAPGRQRQTTDSVQ